MQVLKPEQQLCEVEPRLIFSELLHLSEVEEHLTTSAQVHHKEELGSALKAPVEFGYERMADLFHYGPLVYDWLDFLLSSQFIFPHDLHGIQSTSVLLTDNDDPREGTTTDHFDLLKIVPRCLVVSLSLSESKLSEVGPQHLAILKHRQWPIVLRKPIIQTFPHIEGLKSNYEFLLEFDVLGNGGHALLTSVSSEVMDDFQILLLVSRFPILGLFGVLLLISLFLEYLVVLTTDLGLQPAAGVVWIILELDLKFYILFNENLDKFTLFIFIYQSALIHRLSKGALLFVELLH